MEREIFSKFFEKKELFLLIISLPSKQNSKTEFGFANLKLSSSDMTWGIDMR